MTDQDIKTQLAVIHTKVERIDRILHAEPTLLERIVRLEEKFLSLVGLPDRVSENHERGEVRSAVGEERDRARIELRSNMLAIVTIASSVGALIGTIMTAAIWIIGTEP